MQIRHCAGMVDIETLSTKPNAVILSIGAILFDPFQLNDPSELRQHTFYINVDRDSQPHSAVDQDTIDWWAKQSDDAKNRLAVAPQPIALALQELHNFLVFRQGEAHPPTHELWANSPSFDCVILQSAYSLYSRFKLPVPFSRWYDVRTTKELAWRHGVGRPPLHIGTAHDALDDCVQQALYVQIAHAKLEI